MHAESLNFCQILFCFCSVNHNAIYFTKLQVLPSPCLSAT